MSKIYKDQGPYEWAQDQGTRAKNKADEMAHRAKDEVEEVGSNVASKLDETRAAAAERLHGAVSTLYEKADDFPGSEAAAGVVRRAAYATQATADYLCRNNLREMASSVRSFIGRHPGPSILAAAASGFLIGRALKLND